jgi:hypothetical protein
MHTIAMISSGRVHVGNNDCNIMIFVNDIVKSIYANIDTRNMQDFTYIDIKIFKRCNIKILNLKIGNTLC